jgi:hypothetical protein
MNELNVNHGEGIKFKFMIGYAARIRFTLFENGVDASTTGWTWQLLVKRFAGDRTNVLSLTLGNGLAYEIYSDVVLVANLTAAQTRIEEGEYYIALIRTDIPRPVLESKALFNYSNPDL